VPEIVQHSKEGQGGTQAELHNVYGLLMARASAEGIERLRPDRRPAILTRSGWAGMQRHAMHWTGDNKSTWDHLRLSIQMVLTLGLSGVPISGADVGGFTGGPSPELYARWMQLGAFMPFYRVHSMVGSPDQEPWAFGEQVEAICRKYLELRYRLLPYLYTAVWQASQTGTPPMRALAFMFPDDPTVASLDDEYMLGESLLIAPVVEEGATQRRVYLPASEWFDFWSGARHSGPQTLTVDAPLDVLPLFVRGGAVIPFWPVQQYVGEKPVETLELRAYLSPGEHSSLLYEDDGLTPEYARPDAHRVSRFVLDGTQGSLTRHIEQGTYAPGYTRVMIKIAGLDAQPGAVNVEGGRLVSHTWDAQARGLTVELDAEGPFALHFG
jgi:alpha-glucosidase